MFDVGFIGVGRDRRARRPVTASALAVVQQGAAGPAAPPYRFSDTRTG